MPLSNSVIRRYTPPTCTLEVLAQSSPLSRWMGKTVIKQLTFELRFDDPRLPEERRVPIRGDRDQLEALYDAVTSYVQQFLQQSPDSFWDNLSEPEDSSKVASGSEITDFHQSSLSTQTFKSFNSQIPGTKIYLEQSNHLTHNLYLGSLANPASGGVIQLSLLQLFDLATALDEYSADVMALPTLNHSSSVVQFPAWAPIAAVLVLGVGLLPITLQYANNTRPKQQQIAATTSDEKIALEPSPSANLATPQPGLTPPDNLSSLPLLGATPPPPNFSLPPSPLISPNSSFSTQSQQLPNSAIASTSFGSQKLPNSTIAPTSFGSQKNTLTVPQTIIPSLPISPQPQISIQPNIQPNNTVAIAPNEADLPKRRSLPSRNIPSSVPQPLAIVPNSNASNPLPQGYIPVDPRQLDAKINSSVNSSSDVVDNNSSINRSTIEPKIPTSGEIGAANSTLFDTPQVAEAREFLQKRWQPPSGLTQTLEYSLIVALDGTIERILPLNRAAREFVDNTGIPDIGKPFVSTNRYGQNIRIRAVLTPDGKVKTFPESE